MSDRVRGLLVPVVVVLLVAAEAAAQEPPAARPTAIAQPAAFAQTASAPAADPVAPLVTACGASDPVLLAWCGEVALAFQAAQGGVGLAGTGGGSLFPGNASTLGRRIGTSPRYGGNLQLSAVRMTLPGVVGADGPAPTSESFFVPAVHATAGVGLFDGFSAAPTIGGILSVDGILGLNAVRLPRGRGFTNNVYGYGIGARVGLLRESFTLPGISVSGMFRGSSTVRLGDMSGDEPAGMEFDLSTFSMRATVGKDFLAMGLLAGVGHDRYRSDGDLVARPPLPPGDVSGSMAPRGFTTGRTVFFGGATLTYLVAQLAAEAGWARGYDARPEGGGGEPPGAYDPSRGSVFLTLSGRIIL